MRKNNKVEEEGTYWIRTKYRDKETGEYSDKWKMETLAYKKSHKGEKPSRIKLYADGELVFDGGFKELTSLRSTIKTAKKNESSIFKEFQKGFCNQQ